MTLQHPRGKSSAFTKPARQHNSPGLEETKADLRLAVLEDLAARGAEARVFDAFCGPVGEMHARVWKHAASYLGCDKKYVWPDPRRRVVGDTSRVMRNLDLQAFNVFDLDCFGSPWEQMVILAARRTWAAGEVGAVVMTDASSNKAAMGGVPKALAHLCGMTSASGTAPSRKTGEALAEIALQTWAERSRVRILRHRRAESHGSLQKSARGFAVVYSSIVVEGLGPEAP